jgi:DNA anti-recombination protein RmuC
MLVNKIKDFSQRIQATGTSFEQLRDEIGQIGVFLSNAEKRLQEVEDCYTKLVESLADNVQTQ